MTNSGENRVLEFQQVSLPATWPYEQGLRDVSWFVRAGERVLVWLGPGSACGPMADLAQGLTLPETGQVRFEGQDWRTLAPPAAAAARARIGRVFSRPHWISNLDVDENIILAQSHHTTRPLEDIVDEALVLSRSFGMAELPRVRPALVQQEELRLAEWVRALLGQKSLLLLECPLRGAGVQRWTALIREAWAASERGTAVVWFQDSDQPQLVDALRPDAVYKMVGERLTTVGRE